EFLEAVLRQVALHVPSLKLGTPSDYLKEYPVNQVSTPSFSSWGWKGYCETWLSGSNQWIYRHLHKATTRMTEMANRYQGQNGLYRRALNQAARELFLAQSSDWAFIMHNATVVPYAEKRTREHLLNFTQIYEDLNRGQVNEPWLQQIESANNIFPDIDSQLFVA
ncbi:MAG: 1,4-alpha-glucan branching protein domain-containing protein, partial [Candidatus Omnitrophota bacterium]